MAKLDNLIEKLAHRIFSNEKGFLYISYKGIRFVIQEQNYSSPTDMRELTVLRMYPDNVLQIRPRSMYDSKFDDELSISVSYEPDRLRRGSDTRIEACVRLATHFVMDVLPKVDFEMKKEVNNYEVEKILEVLD